MQYRLAVKEDEKRLFELLEEVQDLHATGRPDIFIKGASKYTLKEIESIIENVNTPVFVAVDDSNFVMGYAFCSIESVSDSNNLQPIKTLYIDDLCIDKSLRRKGEGEKLYNYVLQKAKDFNCYHLTLNVWHLNESALKFYQKLGMRPLKTTMEQIIK